MKQWIHDKIGSESTTDPTHKKHAADMFDAKLDDVQKQALKIFNQRQGQNAQLIEDSPGTLLPSGGGGDDGGPVIITAGGGVSTTDPIVAVGFLVIFIILVILF